MAGMIQLVLACFVLVMVWFSHKIKFVTQIYSTSRSTINLRLDARESLKS